MMKPTIIAHVASLEDIDAMSAAELAASGAAKWANEATPDEIRADIKDLEAALTVPGTAQEDIDCFHAELAALRAAL